MTYNGYSLLNTGLSAWHILVDLIIMDPRGRNDYYPCFTDDEIKAPKILRMYSKSHSVIVSGSYLAVQNQAAGSRIPALNYFSYNPDGLTSSICCT